MSKPEARTRWTELLELEAQQSNTQLAVRLVPA